MPPHQLAESVTDGRLPNQSRRPGSRRLARAFTLLTLLGLAGCADTPPATLHATPAPLEEMASPPAAPLHIATPAPGIGSIVWTTSTDPATGAPAGAVETFPADAPRIIAAAPGTALPAASEIDARWSYNDTSLDAFATRLQTTAMAERQWLIFTLDRDPATPWPAGDYELALSLDGAPVQHSSVTVTDQP